MLKETLILSIRSYLCVSIIASGIHKEIKLRFPDQSFSRDSMGSSSGNEDAIYLGVETTHKGGEC